MSQIKTLLMLFSCIACNLSVAATTQKGTIGTSVFIEVTSDDVVGKALIYNVKEGLRKNSAISLREREEDAAMIVHFLTINPDQRPGVTTSYSLVITVKDKKSPPLQYYLESHVGICGFQMMAQCSMSIVSTIDSAAGVLRAAVPIN